MTSREPLNPLQTSDASATAPPVVAPRANPTPVDYPVGSVKQDPVTQAVAVRTTIIDPDNLKDWGVMSVDRGGMYASWDQVGTWPDLVPTAPLSVPEDEIPNETPEADS
jgi:hypothetical protein